MEHTSLRMIVQQGADHDLFAAEVDLRARLGSSQRPQAKRTRVETALPEPQCDRNLEPLKSLMA